MKTCRVVAGLLVVALVGGCGVATRAQDAEGPSGTTGGNPTNSPAGPIPVGLEKFYQQRPAWERCGSGSQCATITVPLDYTKPAGDTIELRARRIPARDRAGRIGTLFINPGGPGASGVQFASSAPFSLGAALLRRFDVIGWDPRGVGDSTPVRCLDTEQQDKLLATDGSPDDETEISTLNAENKAFAQACERRSGNLLPHVSTEDAARDIDVLRGIVGDAELNYLGYSYGTFLGATYAELFPRNVGRLVLDGAVDPSKTAEQNNIAQAKGFDVALDAFAEDCAARSCQLGGSKTEVLAAVDKLLTETDAKPLPTGGDRELTQALTVLAVIFPLYQKEAWPQLEEAVANGLEGKGAKLLALADAFTDRTPRGYAGNQNEAIYAVNCLDRQDITSVADAKSKLPKYTAESPRFGPYLLWGSLACANWPVKPTGKPHPIKATGAKPIVVIGTTRDPATPYAWAVGLAGQLDSGVLITRDGDGHTGYKAGNPCVDSAVESYLLQGSAPATDIEC